MKKENKPYRDKRLYGIWAGMKSRCNNPNSPAAPWYCNRGIRVCKEWSDNFLTFQEWAFNNGYRAPLSIDRIDPDGNYSPGNCRWIPLDENRRLARHGGQKIARKGGGKNVERRAGADNRKSPGRKTADVVPSSNGAGAYKWESGDADEVIRYIKVAAWDLPENTRKSVDRILKAFEKLPDDIVMNEIFQFADRMEGFVEGFAAGKAHEENKPG